jgi:uncharacterized membrane protein (UPF0127 family)
LRRAAIVGAVVIFAATGCATEPLSLPLTRITVDTTSGPKSFTVEVAADSASQQRGLMYRRKMALDAGMLFDFHDDAKLSFWMKNTVLPLDMLFIRSDGTISTIEQNAIPFSTSPIPSAEPVRAVLEINGGRAHDLGIRAGDRVHAKIFHNVE